ncbi:MAG: hypothetical protein J2P28_11900, partial [Actinobacteria bacterium]|nr:hypothetical protein [Actinomycetota bacterium]
VYVLACTVNGHADFIVTGEKAAVIQTQTELQGYTGAGIPVHVLPLPNYQKVCGLLGVKG